MLYPQKNTEDINFDIDHLHPRALMSKSNSKLPSINFDKDFWFENRDKIGNLQLLSSNVNRGTKNEMPLCDFLEKYPMYKNNIFIDNFDKEYLNGSNFKTFFINRENMIRQELYKRLL